MWLPVPLACSTQPANPPLDITQRAKRSRERCSGGARLLSHAPVALHGFLAVLTSYIIRRKAARGAVCAFSRKCVFWHFFSKPAAGTCSLRWGNPPTFGTNTRLFSLPAGNSRVLARATPGTLFFAESSALSAHPPGRVAGSSNPHTTVTNVYYHPRRTFPQQLEPGAATLQVSARPEIHHSCTDASEPVHVARGKAAQAEIASQQAPDMLARCPCATRSSHVARSRSELSRARSSS